MEEVEPVAKAHPLQCFATEAKRLMGVLSRRLEGRHFVCGEQFTIAEVALHPWVRSWKWSKIPILDFPNLEAFASNSVALWGPEHYEVGEIKERLAKKWVKSLETMFGTEVCWSSFVTAL